MIVWALAIVLAFVASTEASETLGPVVSCSGPAAWSIAAVNGQSVTITNHFGLVCGAAGEWELLSLSAQPAQDVEAQNNASATLNAWLDSELGSTQPDASKCGDWERRSHWARPSIECRSSGVWSIAAARLVNTVGGAVVVTDRTYVECHVLGSFLLRVEASPIRPTTNQTQFAAVGPGMSAIEAIDSAVEFAMAVGVRGGIAIAQALYNVLDTAALGKSISMGNAHSKALLAAAENVGHLAGLWDDSCIDLMFVTAMSGTPDFLFPQRTTSVQQAFYLRSPSTPALHRYLAASLKRKELAIRACIDNYAANAKKEVDGADKQPVDAHTDTHADAHADAHVDVHSDTDRTDPNAAKAETAQTNPSGAASRCMNGADGNIEQNGPIDRHVIQMLDAGVYDHMSIESMAYMVGKMGKMADPPCQCTVLLR